MHLGKCRLCQSPSAKQLRKSHVVSKFMWKNSGLTGHHKSFDSICTTHPELSERNRQDGFKEYLLCDDCEKRFQKYEIYARNRLFGGNGLLVNHPKTHHIWEGLDYRWFKR